MPDLTGYHCVTADRFAKERRRCHRKLVRHPQLRAAIVERIKHVRAAVQEPARVTAE